MSRLAIKAVQAAAGAAGGEAVYVDDVFSTYLYKNGSSFSVDNGIDLAGEGGLVWIKGRNASTDHALFNTESGANKILYTNYNLKENNFSNGLTAFNNNGFTLGTSGTVNSSSYNYVSWTFRKSPGFFDIVTYTGTGTVQTISHNLGSVPGMIVCKKRSSTGDWMTYHRANTADPETDFLKINSTGATEDNLASWNDTAPTSTEFTVGTDQSVNANGQTYVAFIFAHDDQQFGTDSDESIIKCGAFTTNGSGNASIDLGFEPQWILAKTSASANQWVIADTMRGLDSNGTSADKHLWANSANAEMNYSFGHPTATGFEAKSLSGSQTYIYVAIRRPHKPASEFAATALFNTIARSGNNTTTQVPVGFPVDLFFSSTTNNAWYSGVTFDRLRGKSVFLQTPSTAVEAVNTNQFTSFDQDGITVGADGSGWINNSTPTYVYHLFRRAPGFFDVVGYTGTGSNRTVSHNLGVKPELIIIKNRDNSNGNWTVYSSDLGVSYHMFLNTNAAAVSNGDALYYFNSTEPTASVFSVGTADYTNKNTNQIVAYLFATAEGISKVGTFTRTSGDTTNVDCGFTNGARFVLWKRVSGGTGNWTVYDTVRGIVAGNDPYFFLNSTAAQVTNTDYIDPYSAGFTVASGIATGTFLFLAIA